MRPRLLLPLVLLILLIASLLWLRHPGIQTALTILTAFELLELLGSLFFLSSQIQHEYGHSARSPLASALRDLLSIGPADALPPQTRRTILCKGFIAMFVALLAQAGLLLFVFGRNTHVPQPQTAACLWTSALFIGLWSALRARRIQHQQLRLHQDHLHPTTETSPECGTPVPQKSATP